MIERLTPEESKIERRIYENQQLEREPQLHKHGYLTKLKEAPLLLYAWLCFVVIPFGLAIHVLLLVIEYKKNLP